MAMSGNISDDTFRARDHLEHARELHAKVPFCDGRKFAFKDVLRVVMPLPHRQ